MSKATSNEGGDVVEMDAMDVEEWDRDRHTPRAQDANLAALVKQSAAADEPPRPAATTRAATAKPAGTGAERAIPARAKTAQPPSAPVLDSSWEDETVRAADVPKTSQNTVRRTSALPIVQPDVVPRATAGVPVIRPPSQPADSAKSALAKSATPARIPPALTKKDPTAPAKPEPAPPAKRSTAAVSPQRATSSSQPAVDAAKRPTSSQAAAEAPKRPTSSQPAAEAPKRPTSSQPAARSTATQPATRSPVPAAQAATTPARATAAPSPTPSSPAAQAATRSPTRTAPAPARTNTSATPQPTPNTTPSSRAAEPATLSPHGDDWGPKTSTANQLAGPPPSDQFGDVVEGQPREPSVIIDLNAKAAPRRTGHARAQSPVVLQTSELNTTASGVFVMPTAASPTATRADPPIHEAPPPTTAAPMSSPPSTHAAPPVYGQPATAAPTAFQSLPQPSAPRAPSAVDAVIPPQPLAPVEETALPRSARATPSRRKIAVIAGGAIVLAVILAFALGGGKHDSQASPVAAAPPTKHVPVVAPQAATPAPVAIAEPAPTAPEAKAPDPAPPAVAPTTSPTPRVAMRSKKPVVVDYDKQKAETPADHDDGLARARAAYATGNQHLFAGQTDAAIGAYRQALAAYPNYAAGYRGLGLAFSQQGDHAAALKAFKTYLGLAATAKDVALIKKRVARLSAL